MAVDTARAAEPTVSASLTVASWTLLSRATGLLRVVVLAAVLGPSYFGNLFQAGNLLPNIAFELLTGPLFASLLVPAIVSHIDRQDAARTAQIAGGFLGLALVPLTAAALLGALLAPLLVRVLTSGVGDAGVAGDLRGSGGLLIALLMPQVICYGVVGTCVAVQNAHRRFGLPAAAPLVENLGIIATLLGYAVVFGVGTATDEVTLAHVLWLGIGTTSAVALHAVVQWAGARRCGIVVRPRLGWRNPEVVAVARLAVPSTGYAALNAARQFGMLVVGSAVAGGVVAFQLAMNFYNLAVALGSRPVAQANLPELARAHASGRREEYGRSLANAIALVLFVTVPAVAIIIATADPISRGVSFGAMSHQDGAALLAPALIGLALGILGEGLLILGTQACYARQDATTPLRAVALRTLVSGTGMAALFAADLDGPALMLGLGLVVTAGDLLGMTLIMRRLTPALVGTRHLVMETLRTLGAGLLLGLVAFGVTVIAGQLLSGRGTGLGALAVAVGASALGALVYLTVQRLSGSHQFRLVAAVLAARRTRSQAGPA